MGVTTAAGAGQPMLYRQGTILTWNPVTLEHTIRIGGDDGPTFSNLQVLGVAEAASIQAGSVVGIMCVGQMWAIIGRLVTPGSEEAQDAITLVGQQTYVSNIVTAESTGSTSFTDLATIGPTVSEVPARASGKAMVTVTAALAPADLLAGTAAMDFEVTWSGGTFRSPSAFTALIVSSGTGSALLGASRSTFVTGLTPGVAYTYTAKYLAGAGNDADFEQRQIAVVNL